MSARAYVTIDPTQPGKVKIVIEGPTCSTVNLLARDEARLLAALITQKLLETETSVIQVARVCVEASGCYVDINGNNHHAVRCPKF